MKNKRKKNQRNNQWRTKYLYYFMFTDVYKHDTCMCIYALHNSDWCTLYRHRTTIEWKRSAMLATAFRIWTWCNRFYLFDRWNENENENASHTSIDFARFRKSWKMEEPTKNGPENDIRNLIFVSYILLFKCFRWLFFFLHHFGVCCRCRCCWCWCCSVSRMSSFVLCLFYSVRFGSCSSSISTISNERNLSW